MQETVEKTPGVYVRSNEHASHELDMLWSGARHFKDERSPVLFFIAGLLIGAITSATVFFFLFYKPIIQAGENALTTTISSEKDLSSKQIRFSKVATPPQHTNSQFRPAAFTPKVSVSPSRSQAAVAPSSTQTHKVQNGETLERIARKYYGSGAPEYVEKISRANKLANPNSLTLDQALVIPPKNY